MNILSTGPVDDLSIMVHGLGAGGAAPPPNGSSSKPTPRSTRQADSTEHLDRFVRLLEHVATQPDAPLADLAVTTAGRGTLPAGGRRRRRTRPCPATPSWRNSSSTPAAGRTGQPSWPRTATHLRRTGGPFQPAGPVPGKPRRGTRAARWPSGWTAACCCPSRSWRSSSRGAAYLPLDPDYPAGRVEGMLEDAAPVRLLTSAAFTRQGPTPGMATTNWPRTSPSPCWTPP